MINKKKIQIMAQDAIYMLRGHHKDSIAERYFKNDYLGSERMKNMVIFTIVYIFYVLYEIGRDFYVAVAPDFLHFDYEGYIIEKIIIYIVLAIIIAVLTTICASIRYDAALANIDRHEEVVKKLTLQPKRKHSVFDIFKKNESKGAKK